MTGNAVVTHQFPVTGHLEAGVGVELGFRRVDLCCCGKNSGQQQQALRDGDFAGYGAQIPRLEQLLDRLAELTSQEEGPQ